MRWKVLWFQKESKAQIYKIDFRSSLPNQGSLNHCIQVEFRSNTTKWNRASFSDSKYKSKLQGLRETSGFKLVLIDALLLILSKLKSCYHYILQCLLSTAAGIAQLFTNGLLSTALVSVGEMATVFLTWSHLFLGSSSDNLSGLFQPIQLVKTELAKHQSGTRKAQLGVRPPFPEVTSH